MIERIPSALVMTGEPAGRSETSESWFFDPREILRALRQQWRLVLAPVVLCVLAALAWITLVPAQYVGSVQVLIDPRSLQVVKDGLAPADQASDASLLLVDSQMRVLTSDDVFRRVIARFDLTRDPEFVPQPSGFDKVRETVAGLFGRQAPPPEPDRMLTALRNLRAKTLAKRLERSFVVELGLTSEDRAKAARLVQAIAEAYLATESETRAALTGKAGVALAGRLGELQESLNQSDQQAQKFRAAHNIVGTRAQLVSEQALTQLNEQLGVARARVAELRGRLTQIEAVSRGATSLESVTEIMQSPTVIQLRGQIAQLETTYADALQNLGSLHPSVKTSAAQVRSLRNQLDAEIKRVTASIANDYRAAVANEASLTATLDRRKKEALTVGADLVRLRELERQVDANRAVYETFLVRSRELQEQQKLDTSSSRIISPALPPDRRVGPSSSIILAAALVAGVGLGVGAGLAGVAVSGRVGSERRLQSIARLPVMAVLPELSTTRQAGTGLRQAKADYALAVARIGSRLHREVPGARPLVILVASADDRAGKSALVHGLASSAALDGQRALLVDADPEAVLTKGLGGTPVRELADVLRGQAAAMDAVVETPSGVWLMPVDAQALSFGTGIVAGAILKAGAGFDTVIVDLGLVGTDAAADRLAFDPRFPVVILTASATVSRAAPIRRVLDALGHDSRLRLVLTDAAPAA